MRIFLMDLVHFGYCKLNPSSPISDPLGEFRVSKLNFHFPLFSFLICRVANTEKGLMMPTNYRKDQQLFQNDDFNALEKVF